MKFYLGRFGWGTSKSHYGPTWASMGRVTHWRWLYMGRVAVRFTY